MRNTNLGIRLDRLVPLALVTLFLLSAVTRLNGIDAKKAPSEVDKALRSTLPLTK